MKERWLPIPGFDGYEISNLGKLMSFKKSKKGILVKPSVSKKGYLFTNLSRNGKPTYKAIHRLVMEAFIGESKLQVNHKDMNKKNNCLWNLEYVTCKQNIEHAYLNGRPPASKGETHYKAKLTEKDVIKIKKMAYKKLPYKEIA